MRKFMPRAPSDVLVNILGDMEKYCCSQYHIGVPRANTQLKILFYIPASKSKLQYGCTGTLNSELYPPVMILLDIRSNFYPIIILNKI